MKTPGTSFGHWIGGCNSLLPPDRLGTLQYSWLVNGLNRGGIVQTRPGFRLVASLPGLRAQGGIVFTPRDASPVMLAAVDGYIYQAPYPFTTFLKVDGLKFDPEAEIINFQVALKSVNLKADGSLELIPPVPMVVIQDGITRAATFDGTKGQHSIPGLPSYGIPIGLWMEWTSSRLWVFNGARGYVSDLASPDTFSEGTYLAERSNFELPSDVTGVIQSPDEQALLVFTDSTTTAFKSHILNRALWGQTPDFQKVILPSIGCVAGRSPVNQYGLIWWMSRAGIINLNAAEDATQTSVITSQDGEMMRSKRIQSADLSGVAGTFYENFMLFSVPAGGRHNEHTWVADQTPLGPGVKGAPMAWAGVWTGIRPVAWMKAINAGRERLFALSYDATERDNTRIHIWEAFQGDRRDNGGRIACQFETAMTTASEFQRFRYAELDLREILGPVALNVFIGGVRGPWHALASLTLVAQIGSLSAQKSITKATVLRSYKPQARQLKTQEFSAQGRGCGGVEGIETPGMDKGFQLLLEWRGRMGVASVKLVMEEDASADSGKCQPGEFGQIKIINDKGETVNE